MKLTDVIFLNVSNNNGTLIVCFESEKCLFSPLVRKIATVVESAICQSQNR